MLGRERKHENDVTLYTGTEGCTGWESETSKGCMWVREHEMLYEVLAGLTITGLKG